MIAFAGKKEIYKVDAVQLFDGRMTVVAIKSAAFSAAASTVCHPKDEFDDMKGVRIAFKAVAWTFAEHIFYKYSKFRKMGLAKTHRYIYDAFRRSLAKPTLGDTVIDLFQEEKDAKALKIYEDEQRAIGRAEEKARKQEESHRLWLERQVKKE